MTEAAKYAMVGVAGRRLRIGQWHVNPTNSADKTPLVLLGGIGMNMELFDPIARALRGRHIISFDAPGVGKSPDPIFPYTMPCMALTLAALLDRLEVEQVDVLGISWGGAVAQQFAFQHKARVGKLALAATAAGSTMIPGNASLLSQMTDPREYTVGRTLRRNLAMLYNGGGRHAVSLNAATPPSPIGWACQMNAFGAWTSLPFLPLLAMPTLILADEEDQLVPPANAHFLRNAIPGSRIEMFKGGGHLFMLADTQGFARRLEKFLDE